MFRLPEYEVTVHVNVNDFSGGLINEIEKISGGYSLSSSTEYQGRRDFHWEFNSWNEAVLAAEKFKHLIVNVNLLILDEIFDSSLDSSGIDDFLKIIRYVVKDFNIFVISHKDGVQDKFDSIIEFEKRGNFSILQKL